MQENSDGKINSREEKDTILRLAAQEGRILKVGASGKYKKNLVTRIGFVLLGLPFLVPFLISYMTLKDLRFAGSLGEVFVTCLLATFFFAFGLIGVALIRHAIKK